MFTGIIENLGKVMSVRTSTQGKILGILLPFPKNLLSIGQSIAVNGACLTLTDIKEDNGFFYLSQTTLDHTNLNNLKSGDFVNLERPLRLNQELGGHLLTGHVDTTSAIEEIYDLQMRLCMPEDLKAYMVPKGSIAIDGISLTIASMDAKSFRITIIPHTWNNTNLKKRRKGDKVNIEADLIAKYVHRLLSAHHLPLEKYKTKGLTKETLQFSGFEV